ncbi:hypothetical protein DFJ67_0283 [Asanoa ferruginea]|uniref:Uncharacterized protein n=1 Tax=Asanoa ferruginea TaxID=53367 RepID=A0A3D9ZCZ4_9ACTN|nr:DUF6338 family protein [Asanoa ferruginea]REF94364.1 hypothetical protein DFJ67_0283 [Asanoa ferruginea]GIF51122.1 hypothetical protein Afe04nite_56610 [Asanoa ferruginea]
MVPSSLLGLALFVLLLAPGLGFVLRQERIRPVRTYSAFRETVLVVAVSILCLATASLIFAFARWLWPEHTLNFGGLVQQPARFARIHHIEVTWWSLAYLSLAVGIGLIAADPRIVRLTERLAVRRPLRWLTAHTDTDVKRASAWYIVMNLYADDPGPIEVGAQMEDGSYLRGRLSHFNVAAAETADRELMLESPLELTTADGEKVPLEWQYTVVSARRVVRLDVSHLAPDRPSEVRVPDQASVGADDQPAA